MRAGRRGALTHPFGVPCLLEVIGGELVKSPVVEVVFEVFEGQGVLEDITGVSVVQQAHDVRPLRCPMKDQSKQSERRQLQKWENNEVIYLRVGNSGSRGS